MKFLLREIGFILSGLLTGIIFVPAILWMLYIKYSFHLTVYDSDNIFGFYRAFYANVNDPKIWPWLLVPYLLLSLLRRLFRPKTPSKRTRPSLKERATHHSDEVGIKVLTGQGRDAAAKNSAGLTPLHLAVIQGNNEAAQHLLEHGTEIDAVETGTGYTPLHYSAQLGNIYLCELLIRYGANPDAKTGEQATPLHLAVARGFPEIVALLLKYRARLDICDNSGKTPLQLAEDLKSREVINAIKQHLNEAWPYLRLSRC